MPPESIFTVEVTEHEALLIELILNQAGQVDLANRFREATTPRPVFVDLLFEAIRKKVGS